MDRRTCLLKAFVNTLEERDVFCFNIKEFSSRLKLQKYVYLLNCFQDNLSYPYNLYVHGPYSPSLAEDYYKLSNAVDIKRILQVPDSFIVLVSGKSNRWLEIASSFLEVRKKYSAEDMDGIIDHVSDYKSSSESYVNSVVHDLNEFNLV